MAEKSQTSLDFASLTMSLPIPTPRTLGHLRFAPDKPYVRATVEKKPQSRSNKIKCGTKDY